MASCSRERLEACALMVTEVHRPHWVMFCYATAVGRSPQTVLPPTSCGSIEATFQLVCYPLKAHSKGEKGRSSTTKLELSPCAKTRAQMKSKYARNEREEVRVKCTGKSSLPLSQQHSLLEILLTFTRRVTSLYSKQT